MRKNLFILLASFTFCCTVDSQVVFDFSTEDAYTLFGLYGFSSIDSHDGDINTDVSTTSSDVTITASPSGKTNANRMWSGSLRLYGGTLTISAAHKNIIAIKFTLNSNRWGANTADTGTLDIGSWSGDASSVVITIGGCTLIKKIEVFQVGDDIPVIDWTSSAESPLTVAQVLQKGAQLDEGSDSGKEVYVKGKISQITEIGTVNEATNEAYGYATYRISDDGSTSSELVVFRGFGLNGNKLALGDINVGDEVVVVGKIKNFKNLDGSTTIEVNQGNIIYSLNAVASASGTCGENLRWNYVEATKTLTIIGSGAMANYSSYIDTPWNSFRYSIQTVIIESGATSIGQHAFFHFTNLTSVTLPSSINIIGDEAFRNCAGLTSVTIPSSVTSIGSHAFFDCTSLTSVTISEGVSDIGSYAFRDCTGLTSLSIPSSVTTIGEGAFIGCIGLTSITISEGVSDIGSYAFSDCSSLTALIIPSSVNIIGDEAFRNCSGLTTLTIPSSVTTIGSHAFFGCTSLTSVTISEGVSAIEDGAFRNCASLTSVTIPSSVTTIGSHAFFDCTSLTSVTISEGVSDIGSYAFRDCTGLTSLIIPSSVTTIGEGAFRNCTDLTSVTIPSSVTTIGNHAFFDCTSLTSVTISEGVSDIGSYAFRDCTGLTSLIIPSSVTTIGEGAFNGCIGLTSVTVEWKGPISISSNTFSNRANATLYIPYGSKPAYEVADYWNQFNAIHELPNPNAITVGSTGYATFCSPNAMDFTDVNGIKAYIASGFEPSTGTLVLTRAIKVPAGEGLYIVGTPGTYIVSETITDMVYSNLLKGVTTATTISPTDGSNTNFILANGNYGVGFYTLSETGEIAAGKAYLQLPTASVSNIKAFNFAFEDGSETGISETKEVSEVKAVYNLQGQQVSQPKHGLYIINGKKVIIK